MKIRYKLILGLAGLGVGAVLVSSGIANRQASEDLRQAAIQRLTALRQTKKQQVEYYFRVLDNHVLTLSEDRMFVDAMGAFRAAYRKLDGPEPPADMRAAMLDFYKRRYEELSATLQKPDWPEQAYLPVGRGPYYVQYWYLDKNPYPRMQRSQLNVAGDGSDFSKVHGTYHPSFRRIIEQFKYRDLYLIDNETGRIAYTVAKMADFGTSLLKGPYRNTGLAAMFRECRNAKTSDAVCMSDFESYEPMLGAPAAFIGSPIFDGDKMVGVLAFQINNSELDAVVSGNKGWDRDGLGNSGDVSIVGPDYMMRTTARRFVEEPDPYIERQRARGVDEKALRRMKAYNTTALQQKVNLPSVKASLAGEEGSVRQLSTFGIASLVSYAPLVVHGHRWSIAARVDEDEVLAPVAAMKRRMMLWAFGLALLSAAVALMLARGILKPINALVAAARSVSAGNLEARVAVTSKDEIAELGTTFNSMVASIQEKNAKIEEKNRENEELLLNILPEPIVDRLKGGEESIADNFANVSVLFADVVGFTDMSSRIPPSELVDFLNTLFTRLDAAALRIGVEKIKTIGDAYMAVAGLPTVSKDHPRRIVELALAIQDETRKYGEERGFPLQMRIGVNSGPVVAGVIGSSKFIYDLWGDTVNVASRMESHGIPGKIQATRPVYEALKDDYEFEYRGEIDVKGRGKLETWIVVGRVRHEAAVAG
jgi:class 3 adenylate cyclase